jgi:hypothetical protein
LVSLVDHTTLDEAGHTDAAMGARREAIETVYKIRFQLI